MEIKYSEFAKNYYFSIMKKEKRSNLKMGKVSK
jgi:hypothetical protein